MHNNSYKSDKKSIYSYLKNRTDKKGEALFGQWFDFHAPPVQAGSSTSSFINGKLKKSMKKTIEVRIKESDDYLANQSKKININHNFKLVGIAASLIIVIGAGLFFYLNKPLEYHKKMPFVETIVKQASYGERSIITLSDGSKVFLNSGASLKFPKTFNGNTREVELAGEAFFEVKHFINHPFIVHSGKLKTTVLGTSFNINAYPEKEFLQVVVATGKVKVEISNPKDKNIKPVFLTPNQKAELREKSQQLITRQVDINDIIGWKNGVLIFKDSPLGEVADKLEKWFGLEVQIDSSGISGMCFIGSFKNPDLSEVLDALKFTTGIDYNIDNKKIMLYKQNNKK